MKKFYCIFIAVFMFMVSHAQTSNSTYSFSYYNDSYFSIDQFPSTEFLIGGWMLIDFTTGFNFAFPDFLFFGYPASSLIGSTVDNKGRVIINVHRPNALYDDHWAASPVFMNLATFSDGWVQYVTLTNEDFTDTAQIIEYHNVFFEAQQGGSTSTYNFQIWFHSLDQSIEFRYGPRNVSPGSQLTGVISPGIILYDGMGGLDHGYIRLKGNPANPIVYTNDEDYGSLTGFPPENIVYKFSPTVEPALPMTIANPINLSAAEINPFDGFSVNAQLYNSNATTFSGDLAAAIYEVGNDNFVGYVQVLNSQEIGANISNTFSFITSGITAMTTGEYYIKILQKESGSSDWTPVADGSYQNKVFITVLGPTGISEQIKAGNFIQLYPNPARNIVNVQIENEKFNKIKIFDMFGKKIKEIDINKNNFSISTEDMPNGTYLLMFEAKDQTLLNVNKKITIYR